LDTLILFQAKGDIQLKLEFPSLSFQGQIERFEVQRFTHFEFPFDAFEIKNTKELKKSMNFNKFLFKSKWL
jgi:hypothetical protein